MDLSLSVDDIVIGTQYLAHGLGRLESIEVLAVATVQVCILLLRIGLGLHVSLDRRHGLRSIILE